MKSPKAKIKEKKQNSNLISKIKATTRQKKKRTFNSIYVWGKKVTIKRLSTIDYKNINLKCPQKKREYKIVSMFEKK